jgi:hypothetical protein
MMMSTSLACLAYISRCAFWKPSLITFGTGVVGPHDGAEAGSSADRRQAGDAGTGDENLGGLNLARGRDLAVEEAAEGVGGLDDGAVAGDTGLGGQSVHLLGAGEGPRQRVDGQHGDLARRELLHQFGVLRRPDEADQGLALVHQADFFSGRSAYLEDDVRLCPEFGSRCRDRGAGGAVGVVAAVRGVARAAFHGHREPQLDELFHHIGYGRDALLACRRLLRNSDKQRFLGRLCCDGNTGFTRRGFGGNANLHGSLSSWLKRLQVLADLDLTGSAASPSEQTPLAVLYATVTQRGVRSFDSPQVQSRLRAQIPYSGGRARAAAVPRSPCRFLPCSSFRSYFTCT